MRTILCILFVLVQQVCLSQQDTNTVVSIFQLQRLKNEIYNLKTTNKLQEYHIRLLRDTRRTDTARGKDSLVLFYYADNNLLLQKEYWRYEKGRVADSIVFYYNSKGLEEYYVKYSAVRIFEEGSFYLPVNFARYEYDQETRKTKIVKDATWPRAMVVQYRYDSRGEPTASFSNIDINEFWE